MLEEGIHVFPGQLVQNSLHLSPVLTKTEVKIPEPEDFIESGGYVRWE